MLLTLLLACAGDAPAVDTAPADAPEQVTPWDYSDQDSLTSLSAAEVEALAAERLPRLFSIDPYPLYATYELAMSGQTAQCPGTYEIAGVIGWGNTCTAATGWSYEGRSQGLAGQDVLYDGERFASFGSLLADAVILDPGGLRFSLVGYGELRERDLGGGGVSVSSWLMGEFTWEGLPYEEHWLLQPLSIELTSTSEDDGAGTRWWQLDGGVSALKQGDTTTLTAQGLHARSDSDCPEEPGGALILRTEDGARYTLQLHGASEAGASVDPALCDGCAEVSLEGEVLGEACLDFSAMQGWEGKPW